MRLFILTLLLTLPLWGQTPVKNVQVLPYKTVEEIKPFMKGMAQSLGMKCRDCHDLNDKALDTKKKRIAREMMKMVRTINGEILPAIPVEDRISCWTCHRGKHEPEERE
ncbi:MAG: photosynthetic reaction center cytochrome c subunit [Candidatus Neomarinimicrobiota bacterium]|nr:MAG: photosynthetic reaction center cytochrome c subunit [Candidatus Neomarinimicrobiota bacterium]